MAEKLAASGGRPSGFDYMRIGLAASVFFIHSLLVPVTPHDILGWTNGWLRPPTAAVVPMFFALSGFLVAGSLERCKTMVTFLGLRLLRIAPALSAEITISALLLGPAFTTLPLSQYFQSHEFKYYFLNIIGYIHYNLPGVFTNNPFYTTVNAQLWTIPFEFECYALLAIIALLGIARHRWIFLLTTFALFSAWQIKVWHGAHWQIIYFREGLHIVGRAVVFAFLAAVNLYTFRDKVPWSGAIALFCAISSWLLLKSPYAENLASFPLAYLTVYLGLANPAGTIVIAQADLSYGIYLFGSPIQQAIIALAAWTRHWWIVLLLSAPPTIAVAWVSWTFVEKPTLALRKALNPIEQNYLVCRDALFARLHLYGAPLLKRLGAGRLWSRRPPLA